jgi:thioredoxin 2
MDYNIYTCSNCGAKNRVPGDKVISDAKCGKCHKPLAGYGPLNLTDSTFDSEILKFSGVVLVDFWAPWCGPCRMVGPVIDELSKKYAGKVKFAKMNVDDNRITSAKYSIQSVPALMIFKNGAVVKSLVGARPKEEIEATLKGFI